MKNTFIALIILTIAAGAAFGQARAVRPVTTVPSVDLNRYAGKWYEIARYPNKFQKQCVGNTTATYSLKSNGKIEVLNECLIKDGRTDAATGEAKAVKNSNNTKLKVRFAPSFLSFLSAVWGDYWILDLDEGYNRVAIGDPDRKFLWIMSREPKMSDADYQAMLRRVEEMGFAPGKVQRTPQNLEALKGAVTEREP